MKILVTGATGFVGTQLVAKLIAEKHEVHVLVRASSQTAELQKLNPLLHQGDVTDLGSLKKAIQGIEAVIHLASRVGEIGSRADFFNVNVQGTRNLLEACRNVALKRFIHVSSLSVITGNQDHDGTAEDAPYRYTGENYADSKIDAEKAVLEYAQPVIPAKAGIQSSALDPRLRGDVYGKVSQGQFFPQGDFFSF